MKIPKGVVNLGLASFFTDWAGEMIYPLLPVFFTTQLGAGVLFLGLFEGVAESVANLTQYAFGRASDGGRREPFVLFGYGMGNMVRPLIGLVTAPWQALVMRAVDRLGKGVRTSPRDAWMAQMAEHHERGRIYGFHRAMDHAGATVGPLTATVFLFFLPGQYRALFLSTMIPGLLAVYFIARAGKAQPSRPEPVARREGGWDWAPPALKSYLLLLGFFTIGMASDAFLLLKLKRVGVPELWIPLLWAGLHVVKSSSSAVGGRLSDVVGRKSAILAGWILYTVFYAAFGGIEDRGAVVALFLIYGVFYGLTEGPEKALIVDLAPPERRGEAFGLYHLTIGLGSLPASALFGAVWKFFGAPAAFYMVSGIALIGSAALAGMTLPENGKTARA